MAGTFYGDLTSTFYAAKHRFADRDERHDHVTLAREGEVAALMPGLFPKRFPKQVVANVVDLAARDLGELLGELPEIHSRPASETNIKEQKAAEKRTRILIDIIDRSNLQNEMYGACDRYVTFSALPFVVDPDFESERVRIRAANPYRSYWDLDLYGRTVRFWESWHDSVAELVAKFPDLKYQIKYGKDVPVLPDLSARPEDDLEDVEVVRYYDEGRMCLFLPGKDGLALLDAPNPTPGTVPVFVAELPQWNTKNPYGVFDQALWIQVARSRMALFTIEAADKSINAPIRMPKDVNQFNYGPNAKIQTDSTAPNAVERVNLDIPAGVFAENEQLSQEARASARYPEGRSGNIDASVITGQGVKELMGTMDSQVKTYQDLIGRALRFTMGYALQLDETLWPEKKQDIEGDMDGAPFAESYTPSKHVAGNYGIKVSYGLAYGMDHQRGLVFALQLRGDREIPRSVVREQFAKAFNANATDLGRMVDAEEADDALKAGIQQLIASFPQMAQMGQDPRSVLNQIATYQKERLNGKTNVDAMLKAFEPSEEEVAAQQQQQEQLAANDPMQAAAQQLGAAPGGQGEAPALPQGSPQGQAQGGLNMLMANLTQGGSPQLDAGVSRQLPT